VLTLTVFVYGSGEDAGQSTVVLPCIVPGEAQPLSSEIFQWRYVDKRLVLDNSNFQTDIKTGDLTVTNVTSDLDGRYYCTVVAYDESRIVYVHNIISKLVVIIKMHATLN